MIQQAWAAVTKDWIACVDLRSLSVCVELLNQIEGSRGLLVARIVHFWWPAFGCNLRIERHVLLLTADITPTSPLTRTRRQTLNWFATLSFENSPSPVLQYRGSPSDRCGGWVVTDVFKKLAAVQGALHQCLTSSASCRIRHPELLYPAKVVLCTWRSCY